MIYLCEAVSEGVRSFGSTLCTLHGIRAEVSGSIPLSYAGGEVLEYQVPPHGITAAPLGI